ncbi:hypothetical protein AV650_10450 [Serratia fonticola]|nr:hypothetical protein AV650_10450 [Serratia fonticola]
MSDDNKGYVGELSAEDRASQENLLIAMMKQFMGLKCFTAVVNVIAVSTDEELSPVGFVDVKPMVNLLAASGDRVDHNTLYSLPFFRLQGGSNAIVIDPQPGDIGVAIFADRDITNIKKTRKPGNPGSFRRNHYSDGLYIGGFLNGSPTQVIQFLNGGIKITSPEVNINGLKVLGDGTLVLKDGIVVDSHKHGGVESGGSSTNTPEN